MRWCSYRQSHARRVLRLTCSLGDTGETFRHSLANTAHKTRPLDTHGFRDTDSFILFHIHFFVSSGLSFGAHITRVIRHHHTSSHIITFIVTAVHRAFTHPPNGFDWPAGTCVRHVTQLLNACRDSPYAPAGIPDGVQARRPHVFGPLTRSGDFACPSEPPAAALRR